MHISLLQVIYVLRADSVLFQVNLRNYSSCSSVSQRESLLGTSPSISPHIPVSLTSLSPSLIFLLVLAYVRSLVSAS